MVPVSVVLRSRSPNCLVSDFDPTDPVRTSIYPIRWRNNLLSLTISTFVAQHAKTGCPAISLTRKNSLRVPSERCDGGGAQSMAVSKHHPTHRPHRCINSVVRFVRPLAVHLCNVAHSRIGIVRPRHERKRLAALLDELGPRLLVPSQRSDCSDEVRFYHAVTLDNAFERRRVAWFYQTGNLVRLTSSPLVMKLEHTPLC